MSSHKCCKTCALYDLDAVKDKAGRVRSDRVARCLWKMPEFPIPESVGSVLIHSLRANFWMEPGDGTECPAWQEREDAMA